MVRLKPTSPLERRWHSRLDLHLQVFETGSDGVRILLGTTINMSRSGALVLWERPTCPKPGQVLSVEIDLPATPGPRRMLRCRGKVMRVEEPEGAPHAVALSIIQMRFAAAPRKPAVSATRVGRGKQPAPEPDSRVAAIQRWVFVLLAAVLSPIFDGTAHGAPVPAASMVSYELLSVASSPQCSATERMNWSASQHQACTPQPGTDRDPLPSVAAADRLPELSRTASIMRTVPVAQVRAIQWAQRETARSGG